MTSSVTCKFFTYLFSFFVLFAAESFSYQTIPVEMLSSAPVLDGLKKDWSTQKLYKIPLENNRADGQSNVTFVSVMAGIYKEDFFIYAQWPDNTENRIHKPFIWDESQKRYTRGPQREDRFCIQFEMDGNYTTQWFSGNEFIADMWHWKSSRTNPANLAHDKMTVISRSPMKKSYRTTTQQGKTIYLYRPSDWGDPIYYSKRYSLKEKKIMPKYFSTQNPKGSITDVKAKGVWENGWWMLELKRKLNTGNDDDINFEKKTQVKCGIGIFNASEAYDHNISDVLILDF